MGSDSISNASVPGNGFPDDLGKKKRTNRLAKLKQRKLDVRREQWLSQVKNKGCKVDTIGRGGSPLSSLQIADEGNRSTESSETRSGGMDIERSSVHESDLESLMSSPFGSSMSQNDSMKDLPGSSCSSASSGCCSGSVSETEEDDGCLDNWEAVADALTADENMHNPNLDPPPKIENKMGPSVPELAKNDSGANLVKTESKDMVSRAPANCRAWRPDDAFRPQSLPNLSKKNSLNIKSEQFSGRVTWVWESLMSQPSSCPICFEDLDLTDSSFLPCSCGFRLCLFCHKRILEADGRCPGCRKQYDDPAIGAVGFNGGVTLGRSFCMSTRP
ncbi:uncharacterized protein LOC132284757 [Cornus florida]|uniref:uncharacterized protein LOC132284757 n=1 Tax=Cornus florida TaxID=4283 RepID=UPI0028990630|nr:uncharacterized protein LOC132284757 [Cornus florida]